MDHVFCLEHLKNKNGINITETIQAFLLSICSPLLLHAILIYLCFPFEEEK